MKAGILKRLADVEQRAKAFSDDTPDMLLISYEEYLKKWTFTPIYKGGKQGGSRYSAALDRLQDYFFPEAFRGRVILDTFGSPDSAIYENLFVFDIAELREGLKGEICIEAISAAGDGRNAEIIAGVKKS